MTGFQYLPICKGKQGELNALVAVAADNKREVAPLVELPSVPLKWGDRLNESYPAKTVQEHVTYIAPKLSSALKGYSVSYIDGFYLQEEDNLSNGDEASGFVFKYLEKKSVPFIPVIGLDRTSEYNDAVKGAVAAGGRGCCLRLVAKDLDIDPVSLDKSIGGLLAYLRLARKDVDLILDYGPAVPARSALLHQINALPQLPAWRRLVFASSAFPKNMGDVERHSVESLDREEWLAWNYLRAHSSRLGRMPVFGDYGINHPIFEEIDPRIMRQSPNIRYTWTLSFVIAKGTALPRKKDKISAQQRANLQPAVQYPKLAKSIISHESWQGKNFSAGDTFIFDCSHKECVGNPQSWRMVGMSHHIAFVLQQLATLHETE
jgi:hypothetical protein